MSNLPLLSATPDHESARSATSYFSRGLSPRVTSPRILTLPPGAGFLLVGLAITSSGWSERGRGVGIGGGDGCLGFGSPQKMSYVQVAPTERSISTTVCGPK